MEIEDHTYMGRVESVKAKGVGKQRKALPTETQSKRHQLEKQV